MIGAAAQAAPSGVALGLPSALDIEPDTGRPIVGSIR